MTPRSYGLVGMKGLLALLSLVVVVSATDATAGKAVASCEGPDRVLPAGLYFAGFERGVGEKLKCPRPAVAVVAGIHEDASSAETRLRALAPTALAPGYPWVVHTAYLGVRAPKAGAAVVIGMFPTRAAGEAFAARAGIGPLEVLDMLEEGPARRLYADSVDKPIHVVQIDGGERVPAYGEADVRAVSQGVAMDEPVDPRIAARLRKKTPRCMVDPSAIFVAREGELDLPEVPLRTFAPVECGGERLWVRWTSTRLETVVFPDGPRHRLAQVASVVCNWPAIDVWNYDAHGRHEPRRPYASGGSCGGP
jgi:hypothetical protein